MTANPTLFDAFNAKNSLLEEVADTFVSSIDFFSIAKNNHTFVLGPRGCGKTTMFKMLTTAALKKWSPTTIKEKTLKGSLPFIAIYFPSDELWKDQVNNIIENLNHDKGLAKTVINALNCTNIFSNFCDGIKKHVDCIDCDDRISKEVSFSMELMRSWNIVGYSASLSSIKLALGNRVSDLVAKVDKYLYDRRYNPKAYLPLDEFLFTDFLKAIRNGITAYENVYNSGNELKWALCFDELELVSKDFFENIIKKLRSAPPNIVFKLSSSPLTEFESSIAQVFHDFDVVKMWPYSHSEEKRYADFCEKIALTRIYRYAKNNKIKIKGELNFNKMLGELDYNNALKEYGFYVEPETKDGQMHSLTWNVFKQLAELDESFKNTLEKKGLNPKDPVAKTKLQSDAFTRKAKELAINRLLFSRYKDNQFISSRTRKEYPIYHGKDTVFRICEGNPRFIMNIINDMLINNQNDDNVDNIKFTPEQQAIVIKNVSIRFNSMLNTYPTSKVYNGGSIDLEWLINKIGTFFDRQINSGEFKMSPANSFTFKIATTNKQIISLVNIGVGLGAFVKIDKNEDDLKNDDDTRFRLSYLLHPRYKLPLRLYGSISLNNILKKTPNDSQQITFNDGN